MVDALPSPETVSRAAEVIDPVFLNTPQFELDALNDVLDMRLVVKVETLNPIRSFKGRGTDYLVSKLSETAGDLAIVCASAGNFGQGMAYACRKRGVALTVFAARTANPLKIARMRAMGAEVRLEGRDFDAAKDAARGHAEKNGRVFVEDARNVETAEGAGTIGLELSRYPEAFDAVLAPLGNGALINGVGAWFKAARPSTTIIGVVAAGAPAMDLSWRSGEVRTTEQADTIADGIGVRVPVPEALGAMRHTVDDVLRVTDTDILGAMRLAHETLGVVLEPAGAVGLAAATLYKDRFAGRLIATPLCGSNLTEEQVERWL